jgi:hypothetical protein
MEFSAQRVMSVIVVHFERCFAFKSILVLALFVSSTCLRHLFFPNKAAGHSGFLLGVIRTKSRAASRWTDLT